VAEQQEGGAADLPEDELRAVVAAVKAVAAEDVAALTEMGAYHGGGDPYLWTKNYGRWDQVHLVRPPGDPRSWEIWWIDHVHGWRAMDVGMWTEEEGRSDLTLKLRLHRARGGAVRVEFSGLYVM
jgi:hypothetical protein